MRFLGSKYARNAFAAGATPNPARGAYSAPPDPLEGPTSKGRGGEGREGGMGGKGRKGKGREGGREGEERGGKRGKGMGGREV